MSKTSQKFFQFGDLAGYGFKERVLIRLADCAFFSAITLLGSLTRFDVRGSEHLDAVKTAGERPIYSFWHDRIFFATYFFRRRGIIVMTSRSFDGEYIARFIQRFGYGAIRGSSSQGGSRALVEMIKAMRNGHPMAFTVDGPRGPRYEAKAGPVLLAKKTGNPLVPFVIEPRRYWKVNSWDRMQVPKPFSRSLVIIGKPIYVSPDADDEEVARKLAELQQSLDAMTSEAKIWREAKQ